jgi:heparin binding hemagglutinin HbhA
MTNTTLDYVTKPLYATVGAGDALYTAVAEAYSSVRGRAGSTDVSGQVDKLREQLAKLPADVQTQVSELRARLGLPELPTDLTELRGHLAPDELRKTADTYVKSALDYYGELSTRGEDTVTRLRADDRVAQVENYVLDAVGKLVDLVGGKSGEVTAEGVVVEGAVAEDDAVEGAAAEGKPVRAKKAKKADEE